jgi:hypothetical protein
LDRSLLLAGLGGRLVPRAWGEPLRRQNTPSGLNAPEADAYASLGRLAHLAGLGGRLVPRVGVGLIAPYAGSDRFVLARHRDQSIAVQTKRSLAVKANEFAVAVLGDGAGARRDRRQPAQRPSHPQRTVASDTAVRKCKLWLKTAPSLRHPQRQHVSGSTVVGNRKFAFVPTDGSGWDDLCTRHRSPSHRNECAIFAESDDVGPPVSVDVCEEARFPV